MALAWKAGWVNSPQGFESPILRHSRTASHHVRRRSWFRKRVGSTALPTPGGSNPLSSATPERRRTTRGAVRGSGSGLGQQHSPLQGVRIPCPPPLPNGVAPRAAPFAVPEAGWVNSTPHSRGFESPLLRHSRTASHHVRRRSRFRKRVGSTALPTPGGSNPLSSATPERRRTTCGAVRGSGSGLGQQHPPLQGVRIPYPPPLPHGV